MDSSIECISVYISNYSQNNVCGQFCHMKSYLPTLEDLLINNLHPVLSDCPDTGDNVTNVSMYQLLIKGILCTCGIWSNGSAPPPPTPTSHPGWQVITEIIFVKNKSKSTSVILVNNNIIQVQIYWTFLFSFQNPKHTYWKNMLMFSSHCCLQVSPFDRRDEADEKKRQFSTASSDHLTVLNAYKVSAATPGDSC